ncbi:carbohydrate ABC transporter permease [Consotaella aegiceratis]|uniref:carbohydrate ABC transporter permease n=1 Tax=Consotaella aegiceratis TaxID=3097961 RepID=UPI002F3FC2C4
MQADTTSQKGRLAWGVMITPLVMFLLLFLGFPAAVNLVYSVSDVSFQTLRSPVLSGLGNYAEVLRDTAFWRAVDFSLRFGLVTAVVECLAGLFLAIFLAPLLQRLPRLIAGLMLPLMVAPALVGLMYRLVLHEFVGPVPYYLYQWFGTSPGFLTPDNAFTTLVVVESLQWTPFAFLLFYVAYRAIPEDVREAAALDGADTWQRLRFIDFPLMLPTLAVALFIRFIDGVRVFDNVYVLTGGGAGGVTKSLSIYIYETFFRQSEIGRAVAASMLLFAVSLLLLTALNALASRRDA